MTHERPFSDSMVTFSTKMGERIGPIRVTVFNDKENQCVILTESRENTGKSVCNAFEDIASHIVNNLYRGLFEDPAKIVWIERHTPEEEPTLKKMVVERVLVDLEMEYGKLVKYPHARAAFVDPKWLDEKDPKIMDRCSFLRQLGERGSVPPYEPGIGHRD